MNVPTLTTPRATHDAFSQIVHAPHQERGAAVDIAIASDDVSLGCGSLPTKSQQGKCYGGAIGGSLGFVVVVAVGIFAFVRNRRNRGRRAPLQYHRAYQQPQHSVDNATYNQNTFRTYPNVESFENSYPMPTFTR